MTYLNPYSVWESPVLSLQCGRLLQRIIQSPAPPRGMVVVLSAWDEPHEEGSARIRHARALAGDIFFPMALNTYDEARETRSEWEAVFSENLIIVTSAYHQLRAFLTFVKVLQGTGVRLWNAPAPSGWEKLEGELEKIAEYQTKGHVASYADGLEHLDWRDSYNCTGAA